MRIDVNGLDSRYVTSKRELYQNLHVSFPHGRITGIFGPNGVGKSTLLRLLGHLDDSVISNARAVVTWDSPDPYIAYAPQGYSASLMPWMTIDENIALPLSTAGQTGRAENDQRCTLLKDRFHVAYRSQYPTGLSGGQQQMVVLLRALVRHPDFLLLDEPFSALDVYAGTQFRSDFIQYLQEQNISTAFITHDLRECIRFSDRILFLDRDSSGTASVKLVKTFADSHRSLVESESYIAGLQEEADRPAATKEL